MTLLGFRSVSLRSIQNILIGGILLFAIGIIVTYSRLMEFESDASTTRTKFDVDMPQPITGRGQGSGWGRVQCEVDISRFVSYWNDPRSDVDRAFRSPFLVGSTSVLKSIPERRRYLTFEPDKVISYSFAVLLLRKHLMMCHLNKKISHVICYTLHRVDGIIFGWSLKS